LLLFVNTFLNS